MTKKDKLLLRFFAKPKDFTYKELKLLLKGFGFEETQGSGSRVCFYNKKLNSSIKIHKPHPKPIVKNYILKLVEEELKRKGLL